MKLRYWENPHQEAKFSWDLSELFDTLNGKALSYNNLVDIDAAMNLIQEFNKSIPTVAIFKHTNSCWLATAESINDAYNRALECDKKSAFGWIMIFNQEIDLETAESIWDFFCEVIIAPSYTNEALEKLKYKKKSRRILRQKIDLVVNTQVRSILNGTITQNYDNAIEDKNDFKVVTKKHPTKQEVSDIEFGIKAVKHLKSNAIAIVKNGQLIWMGCWQVSRIDALDQAISKAQSIYKEKKDKSKHNNFDLQGAVMVSDAFFPFNDCVKTATKVWISAIAQPGGSQRDQDSIDASNNNNIAMVMTWIRHFKH